METLLHILPGEFRNVNTYDDKRQLTAQPAPCRKALRKTRRRQFV
jgi:hypothetical protein